MNLDAKQLHPAPDANKYTRGKLVLVAGSARYPGAAVLAARASQRMGAGYTEVVTAVDAVDVVRMASPSLVVRSLWEWSTSELPAEPGGKPWALCIGPGFTGDEESQRLVACVLRDVVAPVLVDGGGLAELGAEGFVRFLENRADRGFATVLTPHGGEAARLASQCGVEAGEPPQLAAKLARALHAVVVLKGPVTYISDGVRDQVMDEGTPALAKAGTGDVLAGMIAALLAQGHDPFDAAVAGATLHARAGHAAAARYTDIAVCAEDVVEAIPEVLR